MDGYRRFGTGHGYGGGWTAASWPSIEGYTYLGPCRCGCGPHAFWQEKGTGRLSRGFPGWWPSTKPSEPPTTKNLRSELDWLKREKEDLEERIRHLEAELEKMKKET